MKKAIILLNIFSFLIIGCTKQKTGKTNDKAIALKTKVIKSQNIKEIPDLYYGVDARFEAVKKADVHNATTIYDFLNEGEKQQIEHIYSVDVILVKDYQLSQII